jgi:alkyldihydroxyacetonephosphate synthase
VSRDRERSLWAWGYAGREPSREDQDELAQLVEAMLGFDDRPRIDPVNPDEVELAKPRVGAPPVDGARATSDRRERMLHTFGKNYEDVVRNLHGDYDPAPDVVARPEHEDAVAKLLAWAEAERVAVVPFGGGTSVVGGVETSGEGYEGVLSVDLRALDALVNVDRAARTATFEAGVLGPKLNDKLAEHGLVLCHYPQSYEFSTLGGWIATRSGGHYATERTRIDDFVESVRLAAPAGTIQTPRVPASGAGPDLSRLVIGSEGILGCITQATMRVEPKARHKAKATVAFHDRGEAVRAVRAIVQSGLRPANLRLLDAREAMLNRVADQPIVLVAFEAPDAPVEARLDRAIAIAREHGGRLDGDKRIRAPGEASESDEPSADWRSSFLDAPYLLNTLATLGVVADTFETCTTWSRFEQLDERLRSRLLAEMRETCGTGVLSMRFTHVYPDGPAPYYTFLAPADEGEQLDVWRALKQTAYDTIREHAATITHHHAVGRLHRPWYEDEIPKPLRESLRQAKRVLDPEGVMNPGALVDPVDE